MSVRIVTEQRADGVLVEEAESGFALQVGAAYLGLSRHVVRRQLQLECS